MRRRIPVAALVFVLVASAAFGASGEITVRVPSIAIRNSFPLTEAVSSVATVRVKPGSIPDNAVVTRVVFTSQKVTAGKATAFGVIISTQAEIKGPDGGWNAKAWGAMNETVFDASDLEPNPMPAKGAWEVRYRGRNTSGSLPGLKSHDRNSLTIHWDSADDERQD